MFKNLPIKWAAALLALVMGAGLASAQPAATVPVARVAIAVGDAVKITPAGASQALQVGAVLQAGDRVRTGSDAVAILVFSDEGRISLRADSELLIRHYEVDPAGARTRIELELLKGTLRQISGNASRQQPERYRLNTPIAVIGVRGTDFLAKTTGDAVEAFVHEGQIVILPTADRCGDAQAATCLPMATASSASQSRYVRLSAAGQIEQRDFRPGELEKIFGVDVARAGRPGAAGAAVARAPLGASDFQLPAHAQFVTDTIFVATAAGQQVALPAPPAPASPLPPSAPGAGAEVPVSPPSVVSAAPQPLVWGRFSSASAMPSSLLTSYADATQGRHVTVGELGQYALWRADPLGRLDASLKGLASFELNGADAWFVQPSSVSTAKVHSATLDVDFDRSTFAATVAMGHAVGGETSLDVKGKMDVEGVFVGVKGDERVAGALTRDGKQAGYLFSKDVVNGTFRGITLWGRK